MYFIPPKKGNINGCDGHICLRFVVYVASSQSAANFLSIDISHDDVHYSQKHMTAVHKICPQNCKNSRIEKGKGRNKSSAP